MRSRQEPEEGGSDEEGSGDFEDEGEEKRKNEGEEIVEEKGEEEEKEEEEKEEDEEEENGEKEENEENKEGGEKGENREEEQGEEEPHINPPRKQSRKVEEPTWDKSYRDLTPSEASLSDYEPIQELEPQARDKKEKPRAPTWRTSSPVSLERLELS
jgi:hypothetical protein